MPYSVKSLAERWDCSRDHIYTLIQERRLKTFSIGRRCIRVSDEEVQRWEKGGLSDTKTETLLSANPMGGGLPTTIMRASVNAHNS